MRARSSALALLAAAATTAGLSACGSNSSSSSSSSGSGATKQDTAGKRGGNLNFLATDDVDFLDPGQTYYVFGEAVEEATQRNLYSYLPNNSLKPVPDLADGQPQISADNKTLTVKIKKGVKFSPPVNREVTSKDVKYAIERAFTKNVPNGYAGSYFNDIVGAPKAGTGSFKTIPGLQTPDDQTLVIKLDKARAPLVSQALVMPITAPVPEEYAKKFDAKTPTTYNQNVVFTGPYMVQSNAQGHNTGYRVGKEIKLVRNPNYVKAGDYRPAYLDTIDIQEGNDGTIGSKRALSTPNTACCDTASPAPIVKQAVQKSPSQIKLVPSGGTRYISMNATLAPFDNVNVRKAIVAGANRDALRLTRGGRVLGDVASGWLPTGIPGFNEAGGLHQGSETDIMNSDTGDKALFKKYMLAAKAQGVPVNSDGTYAGKQKFLMVADNVEPGNKTAQVFQQQLSQMGFKTNLRLVPHSTMYTKFCQVPKSKVVFCPSVGWFKDFSDPEAMLEPTFNGEKILPTANVNYGQLNDKAINAEMGPAGLTAVGPARNKAWAKVDKDIVAQAPAVPYIWDKNPTVGAKNVNLVANNYTTEIDFNYTSIK